MRMNWSRRTFYCCEVRTRLDHAGWTWWNPRDFLGGRRCAGRVLVDWRQGTRRPRHQPHLLFVNNYPQTFERGEDGRPGCIDNHPGHDHWSSQSLGDVGAGVRQMIPNQKNNYFGDLRGFSKFISSAVAIGQNSRTRLK